MKTLVIYLMSGPETPELAAAAVAGGADLVELGFPFSDPLADGPVIRRAAERALEQGMRTRACLGEKPELRRIQLVAPTSTDERVRIAAERTDGWLYLVTVTGTTGARADTSPALAGLVERARAVTNVPLYAGFGISTPEQARAAAELADGIVVGSRPVEVAEEGADALQQYVRTLREAVDAVVAA